MNATVRWPTTGGSGAESQPDKFRSSFSGQQRALFNEIGVAFRSRSFERFTSVMENPHGWMHGVVGGGWEGDSAMTGHFWPLEYSAFEPLFMIHHA